MNKEYNGYDDLTEIKMPWFDNCIFYFTWISLIAIVFILFSAKVAELPKGFFLLCAGIVAVSCSNLVAPTLQSNRDFFYKLKELSRRILFSAILLLFSIWMVSWATLEDMQGDIISAKSTIFAILGLYGILWSFIDYKKLAIHINKTVIFQYSLLISYIAFRSWSPIAGIGLLALSAIVLWVIWPKNNLKIIHKLFLLNTWPLYLGLLSYATIKPEAIKAFYDTRSVASVAAGQAFLYGLSLGYLFVNFFLVFRISTFVEYYRYLFKRKQFENDSKSILNAVDPIDSTRDGKKILIGTAIVVTGIILLAINQNRHLVTQNSLFLIIVIALPLLDYSLKNLIMKKDH